jgi:hypothetical protein
VIDFESGPSLSLVNFGDGPFSFLSPAKNRSGHKAGHFRGCWLPHAWASQKQVSAAW